MDAYYEDGGAAVFDPNSNNTIWAGGAYNNGAVRVMSVSRSTDLGSSWQRFSLSTNAGYTFAVSVAPGHSNLVFAGGLVSGSASLYRTTDGGGVWLPASSGLTGDTVRDLEVHPVFESIVFCANGDGVFKSVNGGQSWINKGCPEARAVLVDPSDPASVYAGTSSGVYKSMDTGETWIRMNAGLIDSSVTSLGIYPNEYLFAGTREAGMYRTRLTPSCAAESGSGIGVEANAFPNPTRGETVIRYCLAKPGPVVCSIYDAQGRLVKTIAEAAASAGPHSLRWNGLDGRDRKLAAGVYMLSLRTGDKAYARPLVIVR